MIHLIIHTMKPYRKKNKMVLVYIKVLEEFPIRQAIAPNPNSLILEHMPTKRNVYPLRAFVWRSRDADPCEMPFSIPLDLQQLSMMYHLNVVLPWDCTKIEETFQTKDIPLEDPEYSPRFS